MDGTLLGSDGMLSKESYNILQPLIDKGLNFTVATGRTRDNALGALGKLKLNLPIITDNGTFVYDVISDDFLAKKIFDTKRAESVVKLIRDYDVRPFINTLNGESITVFYGEFSSEVQSEYYTQRSSFGLSQYVKDNTYTGFLQNTVFNFSMLDTYENLKDLYKEFKKEEGLTAQFFPGEYYEGYYWLEILPENSGKGQAVDFLKGKYKPKKTVCFGDNLNDLCMFERADVKIATANAVDEVKSLADIIIGHCDASSVAKYIDLNIL